MGFSLYQATVPSYLQILGASTGLLDIAEEHCTTLNIPAEEIIQSRLAEDMLPFTYQITSICHHSLGAIEGVKKGLFSPYREMSDDFNGLRQRVSSAIEGLESITEGELEEVIGKPMRFQMGDIKLDFVAEEFLLTFSQPNFYFHAATAYDLLRMKGLKLAKRNFLGKMRTV